MRPILISVDGNIGSGKSTLLEALKSNEVFVITEPVKKWEPLLCKIKLDPKKYVWELQLKVMEHFKKTKKIIQKMTSNNKTKIKCIIVERNASTAVAVFASIYLEKKILSWKQFNQLQHLKAECKIIFDYRILIDTKVDVCMERIKQRGRKCEETLNKDYLYDIDCFQTKMFANIQQYKIFIINGNKKKKKSI